MSGPETASSTLEKSQVIEGKVVAEASAVATEKALEDLGPRKDGAHPCLPLTSRVSRDLGNATHPPRASVSSPVK